MTQDAKSFLQSRTIWGAIISVVGAVMSAAGFDTGALDGLDAEMVVLVGGALSTYGRFKAVRKIK